MDKAKIIRLTFRGPVHFGQGRLSDSGNTFDAATFFSALYLEALKLGCAEELLQAAQADGFGLSDAFPVIGETYYLPKPAAVYKREAEKRISENSDSRAKKAFKKLAYLPSASVKQYLEGNLDPLVILGQYQLGEAALQTKVNLQLCSEEDAKPYTVGGFTFASEAGLYLIYQGDYALEPLLESLQYAGLGGKRTAGYGRFSYEVLSIENLQGVKVLSASELAKTAVQQGKTSTKLLLATAAPAQEEWTEELLAGASYTIQKRGGFVQSTNHAETALKKREMYLFGAGSLFEQTFKGDVFDVNTPGGGHPVYRFGKALWAEVD